MDSSFDVTLTDDALRLEVRIVGALIRLYSLPVSRIVELTTDRFHRDRDDAATGLAGSVHGSTLR